MRLQVAPQWQWEGPLRERQGGLWCWTFGRREEGLRGVVAMGIWGPLGTPVGAAEEQQQACFDLHNRQELSCCEARDPWL